MRLAPGREVLQRDRRGADELAVDEHRRAGHIRFDDEGRGVGPRRRRPGPAWSGRRGRTRRGPTSAAGVAAGSARSALGAGAAGARSVEGAGAVGAGPAGARSSPPLGQPHRAADGQQDSGDGDRPPAGGRGRRGALVEDAHSADGSMQPSAVRTRMAAPLTILCIASYHKGHDFLREAKRQGARVFLVTSESLRDADWPRESLDDIFYVPDDDKRWRLDDLILGASHLARRVRIDRVVPLDDFDLEKAASLREHLRVPGMGETTTRYFRDKLAMRLRAAEAGVRVPAFVHVLNQDDDARVLRPGAGPVAAEAPPGRRHHRHQEGGARGRPQLRPEFVQEAGRSGARHSHTQPTATRSSFASTRRRVYKGDIAMTRHTLPLALAILALAPHALAQTAPTAQPSPAVVARGGGDRQARAGSGAGDLILRRSRAPPRPSEAQRLAAGGDDHSAEGAEAENRIAGRCGQDERNLLDAARSLSGAQRPIRASRAAHCPATRSKLRM